MIWSHLKFFIHSIYSTYSNIGTTLNTKRYITYIPVMRYEDILKGSENFQHINQLQFLLYNRITFLDKIPHLQITFSAVVKFYVYIYCGGKSLVNSVA